MKKFIGNRESPKQPKRNTLIVQNALYCSEVIENTIPEPEVYSESLLTFCSNGEHYLA